jgi:DNA polymerase-1
MKLIVDGNNVAWQVYHSLPTLSHGYKRTEVAFGFLKKILRYAKKFNANGIYFCWDSGTHRRRRILPTYKVRDGDFQDREEVSKQIEMLREDIIPSMGFRNSFVAKGYEADDLIAYLRWQYLYPPITMEMMPATIISSDQDLYQLLDYGIDLFTGKKLVKREDIHKLLGQWHPCFYREVKALAGCTSDNVPGIPGVGEKTAIKYLNRKLKKGEVLNRINSEDGINIKERNRRLVYLPFGMYPSKDHFGIRRYARYVLPGEDRLTRRKLVKTFSRYDFRSFLKPDALNEWCESLSIGWIKRRRNES